MPTDNVWWVDSSEGGGGDGSEVTPFNAFAPALTAISNAGGVGTIRAIGGGPSYTASISIDPAQTIAIIGDGSVTVSVPGQAIFVDINAVGMLSGIKVTGGTTGINCQGGALWLDKVSVLDMALMGGAGVRASSGEITIRNSFIGGNANTVPGVVVNQGTITVLYSTLATGFDAPAMQCQVDGANVTIRNSLIVSRSDTDELQSCAGVTIEASALEMPFMDSIALPAMMPAWFMNSQYRRFSPLWKPTQRDCDGGGVAGGRSNNRHRRYREALDSRHN